MIRAVLLVLCASSVVSAQESARDAYEQGREAFEARRYDDALANFERAYELERRPELLFNIGSALDRLGRAEEAVIRYEAFLAAMPDAENRPYVESRLTILRSQLDPETVDDDQPGTPVAGILLTAVGGAAAITAAAVGGRALRVRNDLDERCPEARCTADDRADADTMHRLALTTDIMLGVAAAAVLTGVILLVTRPRSEVRAGAACDGNGCFGSVEARF